MMRHVQLRAFHNVALTLSFSKAALALNLTQPAISDQVRKLEATYDTLLFDRQKKQVRLTEQGERLLGVTRRLFSVEREAQELLSETRALRSGQLRLIADSAHHLLPALARFRSLYPGIEIEVRAGNSDDVLAALHGYDADLGVCGEVPTGQVFQTVHMGASPLIAFGSAATYGALGAVSFGQLGGLPLVMREPGSRTRQMIEAAALAAGSPLHAAIEAEGREAVREIVASGAGIGFVSEAEFGNDSRLVPLTITDCDVLMDETLLCLRERRHGKLVAAFLEVARSGLSGS